MALDPKFASARRNLGNALAEMGRVQEAIEQYRQALALEPDAATTHNNLGNALMEGGRLDEAVLHLQRAVALDPGYVVARLNLADALLAKSDLPGAIRELTLARDCARESGDRTQAQRIEAKLATLGATSP